MLVLLLKQPFNLWKHISIRTKLQLLILVALLYIYAAERLNALLSVVIPAYADNVWQLSWLLLHGYTFLIFLSAPFIWQFVLPRQTALHAFYALPLAGRNMRQLLGYYYQKYQLLPQIFFLAPFFTLAYSNPLAGMVLLLVSALYSVAVMAVSCRLFMLLRHKKAAFFTMLYLLAFIHGFMAYGSVYYFWAVLVLDVLFFSASGIFLKRTKAVAAAVSLENLYPPFTNKRKKNSAGRVTLSSLPRFLPNRTQVLFAKEFLNLWRNPSYRRLKLYTLFFYFGGQWVIYQTGRPDRDMWMILLGLTVIWLHYAQYFNVKYLRPEPEWLFYTEPLRFSHFWSASFLTEFLYVLILLAGQSMFLAIIGSGWYVQLNWLGLLLIFALIVLTAMLNFRIYFYDSPRTAGYAYHFMVIFFVVMSLNYRFVGPLTAFIFLIYFTYKSYRFFNG